MDFTVKTLLSTVATMLPIIQALIATLDREHTSKVPAIVDLLSEIIPNVQALVDKIEMIRDQTPDEYAVVWLSLKSDWDSAVATWRAGAGATA